MFYITALTIAGSDCSGGAGIQADIKTMSALGVYAASAVTAITAQNTRGVQDVSAVPPFVVKEQIQSVLSDIHPLVIKIGMVNDCATIHSIVEAIADYKCLAVVVDPVMVATSGDVLMQKDALNAFCKDLLPLATIITPNIPEAETLAGIKIKNHEDVRAAAQRIAKYGCRHILIKGGHQVGDNKTDYLFDFSSSKNYESVFAEKTVETMNTHGTGCTLSSAIAAYIARGMQMTDAVRCAKYFVSKALEAGKDVRIGGGHGPVNHFFAPEPLLINRNDKMRNIQFITHATDKYSYTEGAKLALEGGCRWIQLRMKDAEVEEIIKVAEEIQPLCRQYKSRFIIDDHVELVKRIGADGVHLGKQDMPIAEARRILGDGFIIGGTANTFDDILKLYSDGADYIGCGPFRFTKTKKNLSPILGLLGYMDIMTKMRKHGINIPVVAIGGIRYEDIQPLMKTGIYGIAVSGSILNADNPTDEMNKWINE